MLKHIGFSITIIVFALAGILISYILAEEYYFSDISSGANEHPGIFTTVSSSVCGDKASFMSCATVTESKWSTLFNVPLAVHGIFYYAALAALAFLFLFTRHNLRPHIAVLFFWIAGLGVVIDIILLYISLFKINALCPFCIASYGVSILSLGAVVIYLWKERINPLRLIKCIKTIYFDGNIKSFSGRSILTVSFLLISFGIAFGANHYLKTTKENYYLEKKKQVFSKAINTFLKEKRISIEFSEMMVIGDPGALVTIVEFSDFLCPYCAKTAALMDDLVFENPSKLKVVFVNYPLDKECNPYMKRVMHRGACLLAKGAICSSRQWLFEEYQKLVFSMRLKHPTPKDLERIVTLSGLEASQFETCLEDQETADFLEDQIREAKRVGVKSTPTIFINGKRYRSKIRKGMLQALIDLEYKRLSKK